MSRGRSGGVVERKKHACRSVSGGRNWANLENARDYRSARADGSRRCRHRSDSASRGCKRGYRRAQGFPDQTAGLCLPGRSATPCPHRPRRLGYPESDRSGNPGNLRAHAVCPARFSPPRYHTSPDCVARALPAALAGCPRRPGPAPSLALPVIRPRLPSSRESFDPCLRLSIVSHAGWSATGICSPLSPSWPRSCRSPNRDASSSQDRSTRCSTAPIRRSSPTAG